jgi:outer membrane protein OmpA-like peptidoglycan-associated protein
MLAPKLGRAQHIIIAGATDSTGIRQHNMQLGLARAAARLVLVKDGGVNPAIIDTVSWADERPVADEHGPDPLGARERNRRIELIVTWSDRGNLR